MKSLKMYPSEPLRLGQILTRNHIKDLGTRKSQCLPQQHLQQRHSKHQSQSESAYHRFLQS
jgi:hypothetical protein